MHGWSNVLCKPGSITVIMTMRIMMTYVRHDSLQRFLVSVLLIACANLIDFLKVDLYQIQIPHAITLQT